MKKAIAGLCVAATLASPMAFAEGSNYYAAFDIGQSRAKDACTGLPAGLSCDDTDTAFRLAGGYQFTPMWGAELSYADLGEATFSGPYLGTQVTGAYKGTSFQLAGTGTFPISSGFSVIGKLGIARTEVKASATVAVPGFSVSISDKDTSTKATYGIGVQYDFNKNVSARAQYEDLGKVGDDATTGTSKLRLVSAGVIYKF